MTEEGKMIIVSLKAGERSHAGLLKIELSDGSSLRIKNCYLQYFYGINDSKGIVNADIFLAQDGTFDSFSEGQEISPEEEEAFRFAASCCRIEHAGMRLIARAEQTRAGLSRKLVCRFRNRDCVSAVVSRFIQLDLVNDERYAERWLRTRLERKNGKIPGPRRLSAALGNRGIGREALREAFDKTLDEDTELSLLQRFLAKDRKSAVGYSLKGRLRYEGFSSSVINRYFDETPDENA